MPTLDHIAWSRQRFDLMTDGGIWSVPRSGLIFTRRADQLVLTQRMPWSPELAQAAADGLDVPADADALTAYQDADYEIIREHFEAAGISVRVELET